VPYRNGMQLPGEDQPKAGCWAAASWRLVSATRRHAGDACAWRGTAHRENVLLPPGTFLSNVGLAWRISQQKKVLFLATEPLTDTITMAQATSIPTGYAPRPSCRPNAVDAVKARAEEWAIVAPTTSMPVAAANFRS